jgi:hypothetical protein
MENTTIFLTVVYVHAFVIILIAIGYEIRYGYPIKRAFAKQGITVGHLKVFPILVRNLSIINVLKGLSPEDTEKAQSLIDSDTHLQYLIKMHYKVAYPLLTFALAPYLILLAPPFWQWLEH